MEAESLLGLIGRPISAGSRNHFLNAGPSMDANPGVALLFYSHVQGLAHPARLPNTRRVPCHVVSPVHVDSNLLVGV